MTTTASTVSTPLLTARGLMKHFGGVRAVSDVDIDLWGGEVLGIIGPNGAGKSTLINLLSGMIRPDEGRVALQGHDVSRLDLPARARRGLLRTFQHTKVLDSFTVAEAMDLAGRSPRARGSASRTTRVAEVSADFGLVDVLDRRVAELPYGTQKVLNLGLVALCEPTAVLLDEPFAGVTATDVDRLSAVIRRIRDDGAAVVLVEHDMPALMALSTSVLVLDAGAIVTTGTPAEVQDDEQVRRIYLGRRREDR